jgi:ABC-type sugar transport system ATPase subunit
MAEACSQALERVHLGRNLVTRRMDELSLGTQELVLLARALHKQARILILDEPTAILSQAETDILFRTVHYLKERGTSILYVSHRIPEIARVADRVTVLRDGKVTAHFERHEATEDRIISAMTGREISLAVYHQRDFAEGAPALEVSDLTLRGVYEGVSFSLHPGEVLGMYGLVGSGRSEVAATIFGTLRADSGQMVLDGRPTRPGSSQEALGLGISYMPEDRQHQGLFPIRAVRDNLSAAALSSVADSLGILRAKRELELARGQINRLRIKTDGPMVPVSTLSGGGQQKVVLARWLVRRPRVLLLDEPTRGIDVGTKAEIHRLIMALADQGVAILLISSDLPEVLGLADHVLVMHEGRVVGSLPRQHASEESVLRLALGVGMAAGEAMRSE